MWAKVSAQTYRRSIRARSLLLELKIDLLPMAPISPEAQQKLQELVAAIAGAV
jgi:hypothetical protein